ncbi:hypothetical protein [Janthinobacterium sp. JC611]|uniref:hypothetical protein n=1 Tax=Janthinobacterium sp. JC611 TaxID=2816201 RepID=UPI001BFD0524|nr:hypothetical protein [Janthinobacterium sp. JC611]
MSQLPALASGSRQPAATTLAGQTPQKAGAGTSGLAGSPLMQRTAQDVVALSKNGLDLSAKGLSQRTDALGNATVDVAQDFLSTMTRQLFGDGATVAFDSVDLQAGSSFSGGSASVAGANGSGRAAAFSLDENAHFIGKGKITTADGQTFDFEVEVQYQSNISAGVLEQTQEAGEEASSADDAGLPARDLPATRFGGNLHDLFQLLGLQLQSNVHQGASEGASASGKDGDLAGSLSLRLLKLVQPGATPEAPARARALALAYGTDTADGTASDV